MSYGNKKPYLFLNDSPIESGKRPEHFLAKSTWKEGVFKKPYLSEYPEESLGLLPTKINKDPFLFSPERNKRRYMRFMGLEIETETVINEFPSGQIVLVKFLLKKQGRFYDVGELRWEFRCHGSLNCYEATIFEEQKSISICLFNYPHCENMSCSVTAIVSWFDREHLTQKNPPLLFNNAIEENKWNQLIGIKTINFTIPEGQLYSDDFDDNSIDSDKWQVPIEYIFTIAEQNQKMEFFYTDLDEAYVWHYDSYVESKCPMTHFTSSDPFEITVDFTLSVTNPWAA